MRKGIFVIKSWYDLLFNSDFEFIDADLKQDSIRILRYLLLSFTCIYFCFVDDFRGSTWIISFCSGMFVVSTIIFGRDLYFRLRYRKWRITRTRS